MGANTFSWDGIANPHRLADRIEREVVQAPGWSIFLRENYVSMMGRQAGRPVGDVSPSEDGGHPTPDFSGAIIETWSQLQRGGTTIDVPTKLSLIKSPTSGNTQQQGTGESIRWLWRKLGVHNYKWAVDLGNEVDFQKINDVMKNAIENEARPALSELAMRWTNGDINWALLAGSSANQNNLRGITGARTDLLTPHSPGNWFIAGHGTIKHGTSDRPKTDAFEAKVHGLLNAMVQKPVGTVGMTPARFRGMRLAANRLGIGKLKVGGGQYQNICIMKDSAYAQLESHPDYRNELIGAHARDIKQNPLFSNVRAQYAQTLIFVFSDLFGVQVANNQVVGQSNSTLGMPAYGPVGPWISDLGITEADTNDLALTYFIGPNALAKVLGRIRIKLTLEEWDHEQRKEMGMRMWQSFVRPDRYDEDNILRNGAGAWAYDDALMVGATLSPYETEV